MLRASMVSAAALQATLALASCQCQNPVTLQGYGSFCGTEINSTLSGEALPAPVDAWLGIDYATQPVGGISSEYGKLSEDMV
ncbi:uncharacterized protein DNG_05283 [Cephalotrichum gorgonifer]|uniref:Uncharacterized protein n=1 Tax=Cephalotrichum gorgonifer TaxID=2041049 RepID=A0AAE8SVB9_9PEZI|nr:uncharacterized protein DNG_05283 [Cephalotrichum gorgonifer]